MSSDRRNQVFTSDLSCYRCQPLSRVKEEKVSVVDCGNSIGTIIEKMLEITASYTDMKAAALYFTTAKPGIVFLVSPWSMILTPDHVSVLRERWCSR